MSRRGRPRKSITELRQLGTYRPDRHGLAAVPPVPRRTRKAGPRPPQGLSSRSRTLWRETVSTYACQAHHLQLLRLACEQLDIASEAREQIQEKGSLVKMPSGAIRVHPLIKIEVQARADFLRLLSALGLPDPTRSTVGQQADVDEFDQFFNRSKPGSKLQAFIRRDSRG